MQINMGKEKCCKNNARNTVKWHTFPLELKSQLEGKYKIIQEKEGGKEKQKNEKLEKQRLRTKW